MIKNNIYYYSLFRVHNERHILKRFITVKNVEKVVLDMI